MVQKTYIIHWQTKCGTGNKMKAAKNKYELKKELEYYLKIENLRDEDINEILNVGGVNYPTYSYLSVRIVDMDNLNLNDFARQNYNHLVDYTILKSKYDY